MAKKKEEAPITIYIVGRRRRFKGKKNPYPIEYFKVCKTQSEAEDFVDAERKAWPMYLYYIEEH